MSLKRKIALTISVAFSLLFAMVMAVIYMSFNDFRRDEFKERFRQRLEFTSHFISKSKDFEEEAPVFFNENSDNILLNETILIFNSDKELIYSTIKDRNVTWDSALLKELDERKIIYTEKTVPEIYAALRNINGENYYILTSAFDTNGKSKLEYLKYLLITAYVMSTLLIGFFSYYFMGQFLRPLEDLNTEISEVTAHKLTKQIPVQESNDEINVLAKSFNTMIARLDDVFQSQKDFTASASHEIRTPITRMAFQLENLIKFEEHSPETLSSLKQIQRDVYQLSDLTNSLLLLTKFDKENIQSIYEEVRIDEVIFEAFEAVEKSYPTLKLDFLISEETSENGLLTIGGIHSLLVIVFINLFKNAAVYSDDTEVDVLITENSDQLIVDVMSHGNTIPEEEQAKLFEAFMRGNNSQNISGSGLGLRIVKRILEYHGAMIIYSSPAENLNKFSVTFTK
ncbi:ATP-binding protein [Chryseobacterium carnipullorum]|uniref:ATP-binding protein n=1 Tax=Chryseobacterium carnipullorum TaxID=1124835 RepID=UPI000E96134E|nr:ATP-binding protein [Chryseobacterium carnipullorum]MDN5397085.1 HAMP domain-containing histidine kinase [Chryseobacterium sp.]MDN5423582.1 HAMP domain-containing histidine kinase [Chryseobacterium sp.]MDN5476257.1 HAMP domain-containing histidine kinase [Chryseobacterium sp.]MDN5481168.1 HAMP domain-containing histidine kinase [Chryseobacterium sp.]HBV16425.1 two-component sensor histidine kinase [Chryseobacterium carnipullorum]